MYVDIFNYAMPIKHPVCFQGWIEGMVGPTFPDIRLLMSEDLATSSWLFTAGSFGYDVNITNYLYVITGRFL